MRAKGNEEEGGRGEGVAWRKEGMSSQRREDGNCGLRTADC
jgi:hypothetical protein